jgi:urease beta subunit
MKKRFFICTLAIIALLASCSVASSPKATVKYFFKAIEKNDTKAMAKVATPETVQMIGMFGTKLQSMLTANGKIKTMTEEIDGDTAVVNVTFENGEEQNIDLIKVNGKWKVSFSK